MTTNYSFTTPANSFLFYGNWYQTSFNGVYATDNSDNLLKPANSWAISCQSNDSGVFPDGQYASQKVPNAGYLSFTVYYSGPYNINLGNYGAGLYVNNAFYDIFPPYQNKTYNIKLSINTPIVISFGPFATGAAFTTYSISLTNFNFTALNGSSVPYSISNNNFGNIFQPQSINCLTSSSTNLKYLDIDLNEIFAGRDNRPENAVVSNTNFQNNGVDIFSKFNKKNAVFKIDISGTVPNTGALQDVTFTYSPTNFGKPTLNPSRVSAPGTYYANQFTASGIPSSYITDISGSFTILQ